MTAPLHVDLNTNSCTVFGRTIKLSPREAEVLSVLARHHPSGVTAETILLHIYGRNRYESASTAALTPLISRIRHSTGLTINCKKKTYTLSISTSPHHPSTPLFHTAPHNPLRTIRLQRKLSLRALASEAKISPSYLWEIEHGGVKKPTIRTLARLAAALQVPIQQLFPRTLSVIPDPRSHQDPRHDR